MYEKPTYREPEALRGSIPVSMNAAHGGDETFLVANDPTEAVRIARAPR
jgi:hypothetical protein